MLFLFRHPGDFQREPLFLMLKEIYVLGPATVITQKVSQVHGCEIGNVA